MKLSVKSLSFRYADKAEDALTDINLEAEGGELLFLLGGNGSGKTTLLSCMAGLMPDMIEGNIIGQILIDGSKFNSSNVSPPLGYVLQESETYLFSRVEEEISFPLYNSELPPAEVKMQVRKIAAMFDLDDLLQREMATLSGGERQRVAIATALITDTPVLLLDEPFEQLDPDASYDLLRLLKSLAEKGKIIIITARSFDYISAYAHRLFLLRDGKIIGSGSSQAIPELSALIPECLHSGTLPAPRRFQEGDINNGKEKGYLVCTCDLSYKYRQGGGIEDINLCLAHGEILAIMGPNGAGKSTLIKHFIGLLKAQKGTVWVMEQDVSRVPISVNTKNIGILFQNPDDQIFNEKIDKEIAWGLKTRLHCSWEEAIAKCQPIIDSFGLEKIQNLHPYSVPRSCRQLVALASVKSHQPLLMILDEPGKSLDAAHTSELMSNLIPPSSSSKPSIIMVTHDPYLAWAYADRIALLVNGKLLAIGTPEDILSNHKLTSPAKLSKHPFIQLLQEIIPCGEGKNLFR